MNRRSTKALLAVQQEQADDALASALAHLASVQGVTVGDSE